MSQPQRPDLGPFRTVYEIVNEDGHITWRVGTGHNVELLHIKAVESGEGHGRALLKAMLLELKKAPPYHSVFGFTRTVNYTARAFYLRCGFELSDVRGVYADGSAVVFSAPFDALCIAFGV